MQTWARDCAEITLVSRPRISHSTMISADKAEFDKLTANEDLSLGELASWLKSKISKCDFHFVFKEKILNNDLTFKNINKEGFIHDFRKSGEIRLNHKLKILSDRINKCVTSRDIDTIIEYAISLAAETSEWSGFNQRIFLTLQKNKFWSSMLSASQRIKIEEILNSNSIQSGEKNE